jgi:hypothetical protein
MTQITDGTRIRLLYQIPMWDTGMLESVDADFGREFIAVDGPDLTERGWHLNVVEPDQYDVDGDYMQDCLVITDPDCFEVVPD